MAEQWIDHARVTRQDITLAKLTVDATCQPLFNLGGAALA